MEFSVPRGNVNFWLILVILITIEIGLLYCYHKATSNGVYLNQSRRKITEFYFALRHNILSKEFNVSHFTDTIWEFLDHDVEKIYVYKGLLTQEHSFNEENVKIFRDELRQKFGTYFNNNLVIDQRNTPQNYRFRFGSKQSGSEVKITKDVHKLMPNNFAIGVTSRCSVVGNSGSVLHSGCGNEIDEADFVFRCNAAPIRRFGADAGYKSNFTTFNPSILRTRYRGYRKAESVTRFLKDMKEYRGTLWAPCFSADWMEKCLNITKLYNLKENKFVLGYPGHLQRVQAYWRSQGLRRRIFTGFYLVNVALGNCRELHLYGFWPFLQDVGKTVRNIHC